MFREKSQLHMIRIIYSEKYICIENNCLIEQLQLLCLANSWNILSLTPWWQKMKPLLIRWSNFVISYQRHVFNFKNQNARINDRNGYTWSLRRDILCSHMTVVVNYDVTELSWFELWCHRKWFLTPTILSNYFIRLICPSFMLNIQ